MTLQLAERHLVCCLVGRGDEISYGFCLREVHLAVEIGTTGVFAGFCLATSYLRKAMENLLKNVSAAMTGNLGGVLACITVGCTEHAHQYIIDGVAILILDFAIMQRVGLGFFQGFAVGRLEDFVGEGNGVGATESPTTRVSSAVPFISFNTLKTISGAGFACSTSSPATMEENISSSCI